MDEKVDLTVDEIHATLSNTSVELHYLFWEVPREKQRERPSPDEWSPLEILIHLRQVGEVYTERVKRVVGSGPDEEPYLHDFNEERQMQKIDLEDETVKHNLGRFMNARSDLLNKISFIEKEEWDEYMCVHEKAGKISLRKLLIPLVKREEKNIAKLRKMLL